MISEIYYYLSVKESYNKQLFSVFFGDYLTKYDNY